MSTSIPCAAKWISPSLVAAEVDDPRAFEEKWPELDAALMAQGIADQLQGRVSFRRAMKRAVQTVQKAGAQYRQRDSEGDFHSANGP